MGVSADVGWHVPQGFNLGLTSSGESEVEEGEEKKKRIKLVAEEKRLSFLKINQIYKF